MRKLLYISFLFISFLSFTQEEFSAETNFTNYDSFFEDTLLSSNPVFPNLSKPEQIGFEMLERKKRGTTNSYLNLFPVADLAGSYHSGMNGVGAMNAGLGFGVSMRYTKNFYARLLLTGNYTFNDLLATPENTAFRPHFLSSNKGKHGIGLQPQLRLSYSPYDFINIQAGIDQNFIGQGNRSMLLGDYGAPYPFVQLRTKIWRIEVTNLYQILNETVGGRRINKFASTHFFNYNVTNRLQIGVFESVVFAAKDTLMNRGFDAAYLNPFLFYRPTEYGLGSQDRLVIGLNMSYEFDPVMIYGQFVLDEFVLGELMKRSRWWANKYGGQIGFKTKGKLNNDIQVKWLAELNFARPFIYSHLDHNTVYGNQGLALAHPMGANFAEVFSEASLQFPSKLTLKARFFFVQQGGMNGDANTSYGNNIYVPYTKKPTEYGYFIGGNGKINRFHFSVEGNYLISKRLKLEAFVRPGIEVNSLRNEPYKGFFLVYGGIRTNLWNDRSFSF